MSEKFKFEKKSLKKERVLGSFPWYKQNWGGGEPEKEKGKWGGQYKQSLQCPKDQRNKRQKKE